MKCEYIREKNDITLLYKCCPKLVPEDSVMPETQTLVTLTRRKGFVGSLKILFL